jgi:hypothetical protein
LWLSLAGRSRKAFICSRHSVHLLCVLLDHDVLLGEQRLLLDEFVSLRQLFSQDLLLFSHSEQFFFDRHALTLLALTLFGKSPADLRTWAVTSNLQKRRATIRLWSGFSGNQ